MSADPNKKSARTFQCRDVLWETFEQMARELECSVDYLVNEAMKQYARQRGQGAAARVSDPHRPGDASQPSESLAPPTIGPSPPAAAAPLPLPAALRPPMRPLVAPPLPPPPARVPPPPPANRSSAPSAPLPRNVTPPPLVRGPSGLPIPPIPSAARTIATPSPVGASRSVPPPGATLAPSRVGPPPMANTNGLPAPASQGGALMLLYNGERHPITKDRFVIGRGKQSSDLMLKDPNVSRQHAVIEFQNGAYFMVDMGSTNGVLFNGERVARQHVAEGDTFRICDHDLSFTYR
jgi:neural Wiskott-Aldrich syndrome protein